MALWFYFLASCVGITRKGNSWSLFSFLYLLLWYVLFSVIFYLCFFCNLFSPSLCWGSPMCLNICCYYCLKFLFLSLFWHVSFWFGKTVSVKCTSVCIKTHRQNTSIYGYVWKQKMYDLYRYAHILKIYVYIYTYIYVHTHIHVHTQNIHLYNIYYKYTKYIWCYALYCCRQWGFYPFFFPP